MLICCRLRTLICCCVLARSERQQGDAIERLSRRSIGRVFALGEALALKPKDVNLQQFTLTIQHGKGDKRRVVGLDIGTALLIDQWLLSRKKLKVGVATPLFCTLHGTEIQQSYVRHLLPRLAKKAGIEKRVHAHALRHAFSVDLVRSGAPIYAVRDALGHASIATTNTYLSRVAGQEVVDLMKGREWSPA